MRLSAISASFLALASQATAQYLNQSDPFTLVLLSDTESLNGTTLYPCHEGAAIEALCLGPSITQTNASFAVYHFNTSIYDTTPNTTIGQNGIISWELQGGNFNLSSPLGLSFSATSNVAIPLFTPGTTDQTAVAFDKDGLLNIQGYLDDTVVPVGFGTQAYYRWVVCDTYYGYAYTTLGWVVGEDDAQNPSCVDVDVTRVFL